MSDDYEAGHRHVHGHDHQHSHEHEHPNAQYPHTHTHTEMVDDGIRYVSVGIDVGSSTTHLTFSELIVGRRDSHFHRKPEVLIRREIYRSPVMLTPFRADSLIDHDAVLSFVQSSYGNAGLTVEDINSGAVICTGEAARKQNARLITEALAKDSGQFVCATAGHHFEALLAAHGSGSVATSHHVEGPIVNLDIGGGTTKRTVIRDGVIENTAAINVGARLIAVDADGIIIRAEPAGHAIAASIGLDVSLGNRLSELQRENLAAAMLQLLIGFLNIEQLSPLGQQLLLTDPPMPVAVPFWLICSGGVSEYFYGRSDIDAGDLGPLLGRGLRETLTRHLSEERLLAAHEGIRATVIGASQFSLQASGETVYISEDAALPLNNVPVLHVPLDWVHLSTGSALAATARAFDTFEDGPGALFYGGLKRFGYGCIEELAQGIAQACRQRSSKDLVIFIFSNNIANTVGRALREHMPGGLPYLCLDEIEVGDLDFLDLGLAPAGEPYIPVVVKSLVFKG